MKQDCYTPFYVQRDVSCNINIVPDSSVNIEIIAISNYLMVSTIYGNGLLCYAFRISCLHI